MLPVTAILLCWKRLYNVHKIVAGLKESGIHDILVWSNNSEDHYVHSVNDGVRVIHSATNCGVLARYSMATLAKHNTLLIQDDDLQLPTPTVHALLANRSAYKSNVCGLYGRNPRPDGSYADNRDNDDCDVEVVCGRVMMFSRELLADFFRVWFWPEIQAVRKEADDSGLATHADDIVLSYAAMHISGKRNRVFNLPRTELPADFAIHANPKHFEIRNRMMQVCRKQLGIQYIP